MGCVCVPDQVRVGRLSLDSVRERGPVSECRVASLAMTDLRLMETEEAAG